MTDPARIAAGLTRAQREAVMRLPEDWSAGPQFPDDILDHLGSLREHGLIERQFGDMEPPAVSSGEHGTAFRFRACWFFRPTEKGSAVRRHLQEQSDE